MQNHYIFIYLLNLHSIDGYFKYPVKVTGRNDATLFWPYALAYCCSISVGLDGYQTVNQWEVLPAETIPGVNSTVRPQAVEVY